MGTQQSHHPHHAPDEYFVLEILHATDVPKMDMLSESDPFVTLRCLRQGKHVGVLVKTLHCNDDPNPVFNSFHDLGFKPDFEQDQLEIKVYDFDHDGVEGNLIIALRVELKMFATDKPQTISLATRDNPQFAITMRRHWVDKSPPLRKTFFIVRHGESKWNEAQSAMNIGGMLDHDHCLSSTGIQQCLDTNAKWKTMMVNPESGSRLEQLFLSADYCVASPLTRALQTALLVMKDHPCMAKRGIQLCSAIRECKTPGGLDTVGIAVGPEIICRVIDSTAAEHSNALSNQLSTVRVDFGDCMTPWWTKITEFDSERYINRRIEDMINRAQFCDYEHPVFVGHSIFFHHFYSKCMSPGFMHAHPVLANNMAKYRLANATVLAVEMEWHPQHGSAHILNAEVLFGGGFHVTHDKEKGDKKH